MNAQEIFDRSCAHLLKAGKPSLFEGKCVYSGTGCALAPFIPASERAKWDECGELAGQPDFRIPGMFAIHNQLLADLQTAHDSPGVWLSRDEVTSITAAKMSLAEWRSAWLRAATEVARIHNLSSATLEKGFPA